MVESQLYDREPDLEVLGSGRDGGAQHQRVGMGRLHRRNDAR